MDWQNILGIAAVIIAVGAVSGVGLMRDRLRVVGELNDDLTKRVDFLEKKDARNEVEKTQMQSQIERLTDREEYLVSVVRDKANFTAISDQVEDVHRLTVENNNLLKSMAGGK